MTSIFSSPAARYSAARTFYKTLSLPVGTPLPGCPEQEYAGIHQADTRGRVSLRRKPHNDVETPLPGCPKQEYARIHQADYKTKRKRRRVYHESSPFYLFYRVNARFKMVWASCSLLCSSSGSAPSLVMRVITLVSTAKPAPACFKLLAQIISTFFF